MQRRCGRPQRRVFAESAPHLTFDNVHVANSLDVGGLTTFYIRRDVYLSFFSELNAHTAPDVNMNSADSSRALTDAADESDPRALVPHIDRPASQVSVRASHQVNSPEVIEMPSTIDEETRVSVLEHNSSMVLIGYRFHRRRRVKK